AAVVLLDVEVPVEAEVVGVRAQEPLHVRVAGQELPALFLERLEVAVANPDRLLDVGRREVALQAGLAQAPPDLEHAPLSRTSSARRRDAGLAAAPAQRSVAEGALPENAARRPRQLARPVRQETIDELDPERALADGNQRVKLAALRFTLTLPSLPAGDVDLQPAPAERAPQRR